MLPECKRLSKQIYFDCRKGRALQPLDFHRLFNLFNQFPSLFYRPGAMFPSAQNKAYCQATIIYVRVMKRDTYISEEGIHNELYLQ